MLKELKTLGKHSSIYGISNILRKVIGFLMIPIYTAYLVPSDYGMIELLDLTLEVIAMLVGLRLGSAVVRFHHHYTRPEDKDEVFTTSLIFMTLLSVTVLVVLQFFGQEITLLVSGELKYFKAFQIVFICFALQNIYLISETYLIIHKRSVLYSVLSLIMLFLGLTLNILFIVYFKMGFYGIIYSMLIVKSINFLLVVPITLKNMPLKFSTHKLRQMVVFSLPLIPASIGLFILHFSDRFFVQKFCNLDELGLYALGYKFATILSVLISTPFFRVWNTQRFEIAAKQEGKSIFSKVLTYYTLVTVFLGLGISIFIDEAIQLVATSSYQGAKSVVPLVVLGYLFFGLVHFFNFGIHYKMKTKYLMYIQLIIACLNIAFNFIFISRFGIMGAAFSTFLSYFCLCMITFHISQKLYFISFEYNRLALLFLTGGLLFFVSFFIQSELIYALILKSILLMCFPLILLVLGFFTKEEKMFIKQTHKTLIAKIKYNSISS